MRGSARAKNRAAETPEEEAKEERTQIGTAGTKTELTRSCRSIVQCVLMLHESDQKQLSKKVSSRGLANPVQTA